MPYTQVLLFCVFNIRGLAGCLILRGIDCCRGLVGNKEIRTYTIQGLDSLITEKPPVTFGMAVASVLGPYCGHAPTPETNKEPGH